VPTGYDRFSIDKYFYHYLLAFTGGTSYTVFSRPNGHDTFLEPPRRAGQKMKNKNPRNLKQLEADPRVASVHTEYDGYGDGMMAHRKSYWVYLKPGLICSSMGCGSIHEKSVRACCEMMADVVTDPAVEVLETIREEKGLTHRIVSFPEDLGIASCPECGVGPAICHATWCSKG
jgi:hypothetical protein